MIRSKRFLEESLLIFLALHTEKEVWPDGTHPMIFAESSYVRMAKFRPVTPFISGKSTILAF